MGANPELGINAVVEAAKVLLEIEKIPLATHEKLGPRFDLPPGLFPAAAHRSRAGPGNPFPSFRHLIPGENNGDDPAGGLRRHRTGRLSGRRLPCLSGTASLPGMRRFFPYVVNEDAPWRRRSAEHHRRHGKGTEADLLLERGGFHLSRHTSRYPDARLRPQRCEVPQPRRVRGDRHGDKDRGSTVRLSGLLPRSGTLKSRKAPSPVKGEGAFGHVATAAFAVNVDSTDRSMVAWRRKALIPDDGTGQAMRRG